jgi:hypothetical protein
MANPTTALAPVKMTAVTGSGSAAQYLGANPTRNGLVVTNLHASNTVSIANSSNASPTSLGAGTITIAAASSVAFPSATFPFAWTDVVNGIASAGSTPVTLTEF